MAMRAVVELPLVAAPALLLIAAADPGVHGLGLAVMGLVLYAGAVATALMRAGLRDVPLGWPNRLTVLRGCLGAVLLASLAEPAAGWMLAAMASAAVASDALDGWLARRLDAASSFGARLDMETDAALMLVLCLVLIAQGRGHVSLLIVGLARYAFVAAGLAAATLRAPLFASERRHAAAAAVMILLVTALVPALPVAGAVAVGALATAVTIASFAVDIAWLLRRGARS